MSRAYTTDITHFLDENGEIVTGSAPAVKMASFLSLLIDTTTSNFPAEDFNANIRCKRTRCKGIIRTSLFERDEEIFWYCPVCQDYGTIHNWQGTNWDCTNQKGNS